MASVGKQLQRSATVERPAYRATLIRLPRRETVEAFDPSIPDLNEPVAHERCLLLSVIHQSILDVIAPGPQAKVGRTMCPKLSHSRRASEASWRENRAQAKKWLLHEPDPLATRTMSLEWCCSHLGILANEIRYRVKVTIGRLADPTVRPYTREALCLS